MKERPLLSRQGCFILPQSDKILKSVKGIIAFLGGIYDIAATLVF